MRIPRHKADTEDFHHYKIGELSKILNMPSPTIRAYDNQGFVKPSKRGESNYRGYTVIDGNYFIMFKEFRNLGLSLAEVDKILTDSDLDDYQSSFPFIQKRLEEELFWLEKRKEGLRRKEERCQRIQTSLNEISITNRPAMYRCRHQEFDTYVEGYEYPKIRKQWTDAMPASYFTFTFPKEDMEGDVSKQSVHWGLSIHEDLVKGTGLDTLMYSEYISSEKCIYTIVKSDDEIFAKPKYFTFVLEYMKENGLILSGDIYGSFLCNVKRKDGYSSYYEGYFPFERLQC